MQKNYDKDENVSSGIGARLINVLYDDDNSDANYERSQMRGSRTK